MSNSIFLAADSKNSLPELLIITVVCIIPIIPVFFALKKLVKKKLKKLPAALIAAAVGIAIAYLEILLLSALGISHYSETFYSTAVVFVFSVYEALTDGSLLVRKLKKSEKFCPRCKRVLPTEAEFCSECGFNFSNPDGFLCSECGNYLPNGSAFCSECGKKTE